MSIVVLTLVSALMIGLTYGCPCTCGGGNGNNGNLWLSSGIVPTVIPTVPVNATMRFGTGAVISTGIQFSLEQVDAQLTSIDFNFIPGDLYTIIIVDLDFPSVQNHSESQNVQWLITNVLGSSIISQNLGSGDLVLNYQNPNPGKGTGIHRYLVTVYLQPGRLNIQLTDRTQFNVENFANQHHLGNVICGNFFVIDTTNIA